MGGGSLSCYRGLRGGGSLSVSWVEVACPVRGLRGGGSLSCYILSIPCPCYPH